MMNKKHIFWTGTIVVVLIFVYFIFKPTPTPKNYPPQNQTIVAFGDSLVRGVGSTDGNDFISLLSQRIGRPIINMGVPGNTSADGLARIDDVLAEKPGTVILLLGGNDYLRKVPREETFANLRQIISRLQSSDASDGAMIVLLGVRGGLLSNQFESEFKDLAKETGSIYVSDVLSGLLADSRYMSDAIHPNNAGYERIAGRVYEAMENYIK